jgi:hypothetical protein
MQIGTSAEPPIDINSAKGSIVSDNLATRIRVNQQKLFAELKPHYDFIVCGGVVTSLKEEHENSTSRIFSNDRDCLAPHRTHRAFRASAMNIAEMR